MDPPSLVQGTFYVPLLLTLRARHDKTTQLLIESGGLNTMNEDLKRTLLHVAVTHSCQRSLEILLKRGDLNLEAKDNQGFTALDHAVQLDLPMACSLLSRGALNNKASLHKRVRDIDKKMAYATEAYIYANLETERTAAKSAVTGYQRLADLTEGKEPEHSIQPMISPERPTFDHR
jgi:hypothetical protein